MRSRATIARRLDCDVACNWKFYVENLKDAQHVATVHARSLFAPLIVVAGASFDGTAGGFLNFPPRHLSLLAYRDIRFDYVHALGGSCALGAAAALISAVLGVAASFGLVRSALPGKPLIAARLRAPLQIPAVVIGLGFLQFYYLLGAATGCSCSRRFSDCW